MNEPSEGGRHTLVPSPETDPAPTLTSAEDVKLSEQIKSLELLYDYTKFHIGAYLTLASAFMAALALKQGGAHGDLLLPACSPLVLVAVAFIMVAGFAGGVIVSSITQTDARGSAEFLKSEIGPLRYSKRWLRYRALSWTELEHTAFWVGLGVAVLAFALGDKGATWCGR